VALGNGCAGGIIRCRQVNLVNTLTGLTAS
jgi:hypothetical protein